jgi:hypothetical protein
MGDDTSQSAYGGAYGSRKGWERVGELDVCLTLGSGMLAKQPEIAMEEGLEI